MRQTILFTENTAKALDEWIQKYPSPKIYLLCDTESAHFCLPLLSKKLQNKAHLLQIPSGEENKNMQSVVQLWQELSSTGATRSSLCIHLGGGLLTDLGGFTASTFKRGMRFINIPTTLLAMVDASIGGKTGFNLRGLKNEIGVFSEAEMVLISPEFLQTLPSEQILSGYAEMIKHALIASKEEWMKIKGFNPLNRTDPLWLSFIQTSTQIKQNIVDQDPFEQNIRKALNLGHTVGHALESLALDQNQPIPHGHAVAYGLICELFLSHIQLGFPLSELSTTVAWLKKEYGSFYFECKHYEILYQKMIHDKKNDNTEINFTLLSDIGQIEINQHVSKELIFEMFDYYRESVGL